jgi:hypothetical protein
MASACRKNRWYRPVKKLLQGKPGGRREKGRPRSRWMDNAELDLSNMSVKRWGKGVWTERKRISHEGS